MLDVNQKHLINENGLSAFCRIIFINILQDNLESWEDNILHFISSLLHFCFFTLS